jgi:hypothetical protein
VGEGGVFELIEVVALMRTLRLVPVGCQRIASLSSQLQWAAGACVFLPQNPLVGGLRVRKERGMLASVLNQDGGVVVSSQRSRSVGRNFEVVAYAHGYGCFAIPAAGLSLSSQRRPYVRVASKKGKKSSESSSDVLLKEREDDVEVEGEREPDLKVKGKKKHKGKKKAKESPTNGNAMAIAAAEEEEEEEEVEEEEQPLQREVALNGAVTEEVEEVHEPQEKGKKKVKGKGKVEQPLVEEIQKDEVQMKQKEKEKEKEKKKGKGKEVDSQATETVATLDAFQEDEELEGFEEIGAESANCKHECPRGRSKCLH